MRSPSRLTWKFLDFVLFRNALSIFRWPFQLFRFPGLYNFTKLSNKLADCLSQMTCRYVRAQFSSRHTTILILNQACQYGCYPYIKTCKFYDAPFNCIFITTMQSIVCIVDIEKFVVYKQG